MVEATNHTFSRVADSSMKVAELVQQIAVASDEQADAIGQLNISVTEVDRTTQQNAAGSE